MTSSITYLFFLGIFPLCLADCVSLTTITTSMIVELPDYVPPTPKPTCIPRCECLPGYYLTRDGCVPHLQGCDNIAPDETEEAIQCGCDTAKVVKQILGEGVKRVECTKPGKKGGLKGSEWTLSCLFQGIFT